MKWYTHFLTHSGNAWPPHPRDLDHNIRRRQIPQTLFAPRVCHGRQFICIVLFRRTLKIHLGFNSLHARARTRMTQSSSIARSPHQVNTSAGQPFDMAALKGRVVLVVNVASKCGFTGQYAGLEELYQKYHSRGLTILAFPCNQFGGQEPGTDAEISQFCSLKYAVTFPVMQKIEVNGDNVHPIYEWMKEQKSQLFMTRIKVRLSFHAPCLTASHESSQSRIL
jgi:glutathione peroxidase-family protein